MAVNLMLIGDELSDPINNNKTSRTYIEQYKDCLNSLVRHENDSFTTYTDIKRTHYFIIPKATTSSRIYQRLLPATNVLVYFINMNEQKNYSFDTLKKWETSLTKNKYNVEPSNPHHIHKSYQLFQRMMIGIPHFVYPPKYLCLLFCGAQSLTHFNERKQFMMETYSQIIYEKCKWDKNKTLFIQDAQFNDGSIPSYKLHTKLMNMIQKSISENSSEIIANPETKNDETNHGDTRNLIASIYQYLMADIKEREYMELIIMCSILNGQIKMGDKLILYPANIEVEILEMQSNGGEKILFAKKGIKMSVKTRIQYKYLQQFHSKNGKKWYKILSKSKHILISKDCVDTFNWHTIKVHNDGTHYYSDNDIKMKIFLSSRNNYQKGIFRNQQLLISYLGNTYPVMVDYFDHVSPSIDTIYEWRVLYNFIKKTYKLEMSGDIIKCLFQYILTLKQWESKMGLLQETQSTVIVNVKNNISFSTVKPFNKFCILARNEIVAKGKFMGVTKRNNLIRDFISDINETIFDLTDLEKSYILQWLPYISKYSKLQLIHRGSTDGFDVNSFRKNCINKGPILCIIQTKETNEIFGGYHSFPISSSYMWGYPKHAKESFVFLLRIKRPIEPRKLKIQNDKAPYPYIPPYPQCIGIRFGSKDNGLYLVDNCHQNTSSFMRKGCDFQEPNINTWNIHTVPKEFQTKDYEVWQLIE